jgi:hypothetical protein
VAGTALQLDGDLQIARAFPVWLRFETVNGLCFFADGAAKKWPLRGSLKLTVEIL